jgi:hypothetical protein
MTYTNAPPPIPKSGANGEPTEMMKNLNEEES